MPVTRPAMLLVVAFGIACAKAPRPATTAAPAAVPAPAASAPAPSVRPVAMPDTIRTNSGTFRLVQVNPIEGFPTDTAYRYANSAGFRVSVFRFPIRDDVKVGPDSMQWIEREGNKFLEIQPILRSRGLIDSAVIGHRSNNRPYPGGPPLIRHIAVIEHYTRGGKTTEVEYLTIVGGKFLKIRGSEPPRDGGMSPTAQFEGALTRYLTRPR